MTTRCVSSQLITRLLDWRNPPRVDDFARNPGTLKFLAKIIVTEIGLAILTTTALVETVVYAILAGISLPLYPFTNRPFRFFAELLGSSSFSILWGVADMVFNLFTKDLATNEVMARRAANEMGNGTPAFQGYPFGLRPESPAREHKAVTNTDDYNQLLAKANSLRLPSIPESQIADDDLYPKILAGANFLRDIILRNVDKTTIDMFRTMDSTSEIFAFVLAKTIFEYTLGLCREELLPVFLKPETIEGIVKLREELLLKKHLLPTIKTELELTFTSLELFEQGPQNNTPIDLFKKLKGIAHPENKGESIFITSCWLQAIDFQPRATG